MGRRHWSRRTACALRDQAPASRSAAALVVTRRWHACENSTVQRQSPGVRGRDSFRSCELARSRRVVQHASPAPCSPARQARSPAGRRLSDVALMRRGVTGAGSGTACPGRREHQPPGCSEVAKRQRLPGVTAPVSAPPLPKVRRLSCPGSDANSCCSDRTGAPGKRRRSLGRPESAPRAEVPLSQISQNPGAARSVVRHRASRPGRVSSVKAWVMPRLYASFVDPRRQWPSGHHGKWIERAGDCRHGRPIREGFAAAALIAAKAVLVGI